MHNLVRLRLTKVKRSNHR